MEEINLYKFNYNNDEEYYDIKGKSITKSLMKTPINGREFSSSFGMRKHQLGYNKMHRGTVAQIRLYRMALVVHYKSKMVMVMVTA